jgi:type IV secretion system protein VirB9
MIKKFILTLGMAAVLSVQSSFAYASEIDDIDSMIKQQQQIIAVLNSKKSDIELSDRLKSIEKQLTGLKEQKQYDAESAIEALSAQLNLLKESVERQSEMQQKIMGYFDKLEKENLRVQNNDAYPRKQASGTTAAYLVNPGPNKNVSYTQDAINSQGNSTMVFSYAPNQLYKIYCRAGYLTDLTLKKGEKISFVGGGDTSAWAVNSAEVDNEPHLYIKPVTISRA